jgi:hypothetical protein
MVCFLHPEDVAWVLIPVKAGDEGLYPTPNALVLGP